MIEELLAAATTMIRPLDVEGPRPRPLDQEVEGRGKYLIFLTEAGKKELNRIELARVLEKD
jgi:hypothetical protein